MQHAIFYFCNKSTQGQTGDSFCNFHEGPALQCIPRPTLVNSFLTSLQSKVEYAPENGLMHF